MRFQSTKICLSLAITTAGLTGCQWHQQGPAQTEQMSDAPLVIDEATQKRDFPKTEAVYPNGAVVAGSTWETFDPSPNLPYNLSALTETPIAVGNAFLTPIQMFVSPPGKKVTSSGAVIESSYTAMPALPAAPGAQAQGHEAPMPSATPPAAQP
ncbi:MAG TPA: hypothetical protein VL282_00970 [Tepidisphaeraceae bacterium]|jgi:hypothetical protein|nr:hypothetical protein [Tepidisphaeraceae bacterium]